MKKLLKQFFYFLKLTSIKIFEWFYKVNPKILRFCNIILSFLSIFAGLLTIFLLGNLYTPTVGHNLEPYIDFISWSISIIYLIQIILLILPGGKKFSWSNLLLKMIFIITINYFVYFIPDFISPYLHDVGYIHYYKLFLIFLVFIRTISLLAQNLYKISIHPAKIFIISFIIIIIIGSLLLLLPAATYRDIKYEDSLFVTVSAVCVTGLTTVNIASTFTWFGKLIIIILIQLGGLGIMTITSFLALSFTRTDLSIKEQQGLEFNLGSSSFREIKKNLYAIILITALFESIGAILIYFSVPDIYFDNLAQHIFFAIFHSVSAFCNAGFSNLPDGMMNEVFVNNYLSIFTISGLIIFGGIGFFVINSLLKNINFKFKNLIRKIFNKPKIIKPKIININNLIVTRTTLILIILAIAVILILESNNSLISYNWFDKVVQAFFCSVTPRTAGFNTLDFASFTPATIMFIIILMWIGASPGSTGGGIKTTSIALAFLNAISIGRNQDKITFKNRTISNITVQKSFVIIVFSLLTILIGIIFVCAFDPHLGFMNIMFEVFSAFGTVGLTLGITPNLSLASKIVIIIEMFVGRMQFVILFLAIIKRAKRRLIKYPEIDLYL
ncbi:MAG: potassium transporter TrkG [Bacteroidales bacterium]|nr:ATPase [Bacteroidales bacterium]MDI9575730.1 potassium transporter TrkG [Bacteroidota bacterium]HHW59960.1 ATPase [Bacteroidales bacterium]